MFVSTTMRSPLGVLRLVASDAGLVSLSWPNAGPQLVARRDPAHPVLLETERQLKEYFSGKRRTFALKLDLIGSTFQKKVWTAMAEIPFAETRSYGDVAAIVGHPGAARAVGTANATNPISIITPCHRVVASTGKIRGPESGAQARAKLLAFEQSLVERSPKRTSKTTAS